MHFLHHRSSPFDNVSLLYQQTFFKLIFLFSFFSIPLFAQESNWELYNIKVYMENDLLSGEDSQYTGGTKIDIVYKINNPDSLYNLLFVDDSKSYYFRSFAIANQLYTPADLTKSEPIYDDWSYAAWTYIESGIHKSTQNSLSSLIIRVGMVGPSAQGEAIQKSIHKWTGSTMPEGWHNQLYDELGINFTYLYKRRYEYENSSNSWGISCIPTLSVDVGNISTQASAGLFIRSGYNIIKDFGISTISVSGESSIPAYEVQKTSLKKKWSFSLNAALRGSAVARDIFVEGNTFKHSIVEHERKNFVGYIGAGFTLRYKKYTVDFMQMHNTARAKDIQSSHTVGTLVFTYFY